MTNDPGVMWLNVTNAILGMCVAVCVLVLMAGVAREVAGRIRQRLKARSYIVYDPYTSSSAELGLTMADGGEPVRDAEKHRGDPK